MDKKANEVAEKAIQLMNQNPNLTIVQSVDKAREVLGYGSTNSDRQ